MKSLWDFSAPRPLPHSSTPELPLAARLGHCRGARPSRLPFSASRRKPVSQTKSFDQWFGRDARTRTRDARAPPNRPSQNENRKRSPDHYELRITNCGARDPSVTGSATVPVAVFGVAPKTVSQTKSFDQWFGRDARTRTRDARAPPNRPSQNEYRKRAVQVRNGECGVRPNLISVLAQPRA